MYRRTYISYTHILSDWSYDYQNQWGQESRTCIYGRSQSPIHLEVYSSRYDSSLKTLTVNQEDINHSSKNKMTLINYGHSR